MLIPGYVAPDGDYLHRFVNILLPILCGCLHCHVGNLVYKLVRELDHC